jgi:hypothetical protein
VGYVANLSSASGGVHETAQMVREILEAAPSSELPTDVVDGYTVINRPTRWTAVHDGGGPDRAA